MTYRSQHSRFLNSLRTPWFAALCVMAVVGIGWKLLTSTGPTSPLVELVSPAPSENEPAATDQAQPVPASRDAAGPLPTVNGEPVQESQAPPPTTEAASPASSVVATTAPSASSAPSTNSEEGTATPQPAGDNDESAIGPPQDDLFSIGEGDVALAGLRAPVWDTAWDAPFFATLDEIDQYFSYLSDRGYAGTWMMLLGLNARRDGTDMASPAYGALAATHDNGQLVATPENLAHMRSILDLAELHGLEVGLVPAWGQHWHNSHGTNCWGLASRIGNGPLQASNAFAFGQQIGAALGDHPALGFWVMGGDNWCQGSLGVGSEDPQVWRNLAAGLDSVGATQPTTYHTPADVGWGLRPAHLWMINEPWLDFLAPQTGHCVSAMMLADQLSSLGAATAKPIVAAEMRYETPPGILNHCGSAVTAADVEADTRAALDVGVAGVVFGHQSRWSWGADDGRNIFLGHDYNSVAITYGSAAEQAMLDLLLGG